MIRTNDAYTAIYTYDSLSDVDPDCVTHVIWQTTQIVRSEEEAIALVLGMTNVLDVRIIKIPDLPEYILPDTLKRHLAITGEIVDYGQASDTEQHEDQCDRAEPDAEDREIFSGT